MIFETTANYLKWLVMLLLENTEGVPTTILLYKAVQSASRYFLKCMLNVTMNCYFPYFGSLYYTIQIIWLYLFDKCKHSFHVRNA